jgi:hypothetical protein
MADDLLDFMRAWRSEYNAAQAAQQRLLNEIISRLSRLEREVAALHGNVAGLHGDYAILSTRLDNVNLRLDRIERRLELREESAP